MLITVLNLFTIFNKTIIAFFLWSKKNNSLSTKLLSLIILFPIFTFASNYLLYTEQYQYGFMVFVCQLTNHFIGPFIYMYCRLMMGKPIKRGWSMGIYFIPALFPMACWLVYLFSYSPAEQLYFLQIATTRPDTLFVAMNHAIELSFVVFTGLSLYETWQHDRQLKIDNHHEKRQQLKWVNTFMKLMFTLSICVAISDFAFPDAFGELVLLPIWSNIFFFYILYQAFNNSVVFDKYEYMDFQESMERASVDTRYLHSQMGLKEIALLGKDLEAYFTNEKPYLDPDLTVALLAENRQVSASKMSEIINRHFDQTFFDLINTYRVGHAQVLLNNPSYNYLTMEGLAEESGFGSKATFNRAFKKVTGNTPSHFKREQKA